MDYTFFHNLTFDVLYGCIALLTFVVFERALYYGYLSARSRSISAKIHGADFDPLKQFGTDAGNDTITRAVVEYVDAQRHGAARAKIEDLSAALYIWVDGRIGARLWVLDTIVTAAPLLGLLGTILGIMQTFTALSQGGISDPGEVSRGIGTALLATAVGIGTALYGLVTHNMLHRQAEHLTEGFKGFLLRTTI